ncbi:MAG: hypothetical protein IPI49_10095 [Myxococcales bacterium]|nr:hypothetical protein [Myxococcales bacterium]
MRELSSRTASLALALAILCLTLGQPMSAQAQARPEAEQLFREGKRLMKEGKTTEACEAFEASEKAEPNLSTLLSLADCHEKAEQLASAWARFLAAESRARGEAQKAALGRTAKQRAAALEGRLSYLTINVPDDSRVTGLVVTRDGVEVDAAQWNRAVPMDGGPHVISGKAPGHESWQTTVQVAVERDQRSVEVPRFKELPALALPPPGLAAAPAATEGERALSAPRVMARAPAPSAMPARRKVVLGVAAGGVVAAGTAIGFGLAARSARSDALATCSPSACTAAAAAAAQDQNDRARSHALVANVGYAVAGAAAVGALVLWFTAPTAPLRERQSETASLSISPLLGAGNGFVVSGGF